MTPLYFGAGPNEWAHLDILLGLTEDLLPVVANPHAEISPDSAMKGIGKTPSIYNASRKIVGLANWTQRIASPRDIQKWEKEKDYGICIQTRRVRAIDIDVDDPGVAGAIRARIDSRVRLPARTRDNAAKLLLAFELPGEFTKRKFKTAHGIVEFLATGQQFVAVGTHTSGARYVWKEGLPDVIPALTAEEFEALWSDLVAEFAIEDSQTTAVSVKREKLELAVSSDPVVAKLSDLGLVRKVERDGRIHITCPFEEEHTSDSAESATTYWPAHTGGYVNGHFHCLHAHCEHREDAEFLNAIGYVDETVLHEFEALAEEIAEHAPELAAIEEPEAPTKPPRFAVEHAADFIDRPPPQWIVKGVLPRAELIVLFGESGSGKSFVALDIGMAIARGIDWRGHRTRPGRVSYIAAEGAGGFRNRVRAYSQITNIDLAALPFGVIHAAPNLLEKVDALDVSKAIIGWGRADVVFVDTLAQTMPGGNENAGEDMGKVLAHCKGIHRATGATVVLIHHAGKDTTKGARGWSGLRAAADAELEVVRTDAGRYLRISKQKDGDDTAEWGFALEQVQVGVDEDGDSITSCVIIEAEVPSGRAARRRLGPWEKMVSEVVGEIGLSQTQGIEIKAIVDETAKRMPEPEKGKRDTRKQHAKRALTSLCTGDDAPYVLEDDCISIL